MNRFSANILKLIVLVFSLTYSISSFSQKKPDPLLKSANDAFYSQKWKSAATLLDLYLKDSTNFSESYKMAIIANLMSSDSEGIDKGIKLIENQDKSMSEVLKNISQELIKLKMFDDYEIIIHKIINKMPNKKVLLFENLLEFRTLLHQPKHVIRLIEDAKIYDIPTQPYIKKKADNYILSNNIDKAFEIYDSIYSSNPKDKDAIIFMGNYYYVKGKLKYDEVIKEYDKIENPTNIDFADKRNKIGMIYREYFIRGIQWLEKSKSIAKNDNIEKNLAFMYDVRAKYSTDISSNSTRRKNSNKQ